MRWNKEFYKEAVFVWKPFCSFYFFRYRQTNQWLFYKIYHRIVVRFLASLTHWLHFPCFLSHSKPHLTYMRINLVWTLAVGEYSLGVLTSLGDCLDLTGPQYVKMKWVCSELRNKAKKNINYRRRVWSQKCYL